jgi:carboxypeptidase T
MTRGCLPRLAPPSLVIAVLLTMLVAPTQARAASEFPKGWEGYHTYTEMTTEVGAVATAHPDIVRRFSIGKSYLGHTIWAAKISDNVATDENEPEVLFDGGTHSDEHMGVEMSLRILHWLVDGYGKDPRITSIVNSREIWIVFMVNPDGAIHDIAGGKFHFWRKNRQPTPGTTSIGTDLNRNFGYRWGGGGRTSSNPQAITYRGPAAFSAPETRAMRDFLASRVIGGRQQIRTAITFHETGRLVMWPYGYTRTDIPRDMTKDDHTALRAIGRHMASTNGYKPEQASDLYVSSGTTRDDEYGTYRIFAYTFELSVKDYPDDSKIKTETGRNKEAVLYLMERAWCPLSVVSASVRAARCGAFDDDVEVSRGWAANPDGTDTAPANAKFSRSTPQATSSSGAKQRSNATSGTKVFVTGAAAGASANANDLDGVSTLRSPAITLPPTAGQKLTFRYVFAHSAASSSADSLQAIIERADTSQTVVWSVAGAPVDRDGAWATASIGLDTFAGETVRIRFVAADGGPDDLVEVELDDIRVTRGT